VFHPLSYSYTYSYTRLFITKEHKDCRAQALHGSGTAVVAAARRMIVGPTGVAELQAAAPATCFAGVKHSRRDLIDPSDRGAVTSVSKVIKVIKVNSIVAPTKVLGERRD